jgi:hypothetical protein
MRPHNEVQSLYDELVVEHVVCKLALAGLVIFEVIQNPTHAH